jgi:hypothetical protein
LFTVKVYENDDDPLEANIWAGRFTKIDFETFDEDHKTAIVKPINADRYDKIIAAMEKEFNLIDLSPAITPVNVERKAVFQVHISGSAFVANFLAGTYWETVLDGGFNQADNLLQGFVIPGNDTVLDPDVSGVYIYDGGSNEHPRQDGAYYIKYNPTFGVTAWEILEFGTNAVKYRAGSGQTLPGFANPFTPGEAVFESLATSDNCNIFGIALTGRILTNKADVYGNPTTPIPAGDTDEGGNYDNVIGINEAAGLPTVEIYQIFTASFLNSTDPDKYGKFYESALHFADKYFNTPGAGFLPIQRSSWTSYSLWFLYNATMKDLQDEASDTFVVENCYKISDVLSVLLQAIDDELSHEATAAFSDFYYAANSIRGTFKTLIITPKSNFLVGQYDQPAERATITLRAVFDLLKYAHNVFWYIDSENRLVLEHLNFYENGGVYYAENIGADLTELYEAKTGLKWGYLLNKYKFDRVDMPERIVTKFMDKQSFAFESTPIDVVSNYVDKGNIEERVLGLFSADVDFMLANVDEIATDGFVAMDCFLNDSNEYYMPTVDLSLFGYEGVKTQNGYLSLAWLQHNLLRHGLPANNVIVNGSETTAITIKRTKIQDIVFGAFDFDPLQLIKTDLGVGQIKSLEVRLHGGDIKGEIKLNVLG